MAAVTSNAKAVAGNGLGPRTRIINAAKTNMKRQTKSYGFIKNMRSTGTVWS